MSLVPAKCTQCGANIEIDSTKEAGICPNCGTAFISEKAINNYITNNNNVFNIEKANIFLNNHPKEESKIMVYGITQFVIGGTVKVYWNNNFVGKLPKGGLIEIPIKEDGVLSISCGINPVKGKTFIKAGKTTKVQIIYNRLTGGFIPQIVDTVVNGKI